MIHILSFPCFFQNSVCRNLTLGRYERVLFFSFHFRQKDVEKSFCFCTIMPVEDNVRLLAESAEIFVYGITEQ